MGKKQPEKSYQTCFSFFTTWSSKDLFNKTLSIWFGSWADVYTNWNKQSGKKGARNETSICKRENRNREKKIEKCFPRERVMGCPLVDTFFARRKIQTSTIIIKSMKSSTLGKTNFPSALSLDIHIFRPITIKSPARSFITQNENENEW